MRRSHTLDVSQKDDVGAYRRAWRKANPEAYAYNAAAYKARLKALAKLAARHPDEFEVLLNVERAAKGLLPRGVPGSPQYNKR